MSSIATVKEPVEKPVGISAEYKKTRPGAMIAFAFGQVSDNMEGGLINTLFPVIMKALNLDVGALGVLSSISKWARMLFGTAWAVIGDKIGRKKVLVVMTGVWGLWTAAAGLAQNYTQLLILYSIGVIGTVAAEPIQNGLMVDMFEDEERGKAYGLLRSIGSIAGLFLTPAIGQLANVQDGWRIGMYIMGGISVLSGILLMVFLKEPPRRVVAGDPDAGKFKLADIGQITKIPTFWLLAVMLLFVTSMVFFAFMVTYFVKVRGWETASAAILYTVFMAGFGISGYFGGMFGDMFEKKEHEILGAEGFEGQVRAVAARVASGSPGRCTTYPVTVAAPLAGGDQDSSTARCPSCARGRARRASAMARWRAASVRSSRRSNPDRAVDSQGRALEALPAGGLQERPMACRHPPDHGPIVLARPIHQAGRREPVEVLLDRVENHSITRIRQLFADGCETHVVAEQTLHSILVSVSPSGDSTRHGVGPVRVCRHQRRPAPRKVVIAVRRVVGEHGRRDLHLRPVLADLHARLVRFQQVRRV